MAYVLLPRYTMLNSRRGETIDCFLASCVVQLTLGVFNKTFDPQHSGDLLGRLSPSLMLRSIAKDHKSTCVFYFDCFAIIYLLQQATSMLRPSNHLTSCKHASLQRLVEYKWEPDMTKIL